MYYLNNTTYNEKTLIGRLRRYFLIYFETFSVSTADSLFLLILSILALESAHSICFLYHHFLSGITKKSLNVFYYACSYARIDSVRYDLAPERTGRRGRPAKHGQRLFFSTIFSEDLKVFCTEEEHSSSDQTDHDPVNYIRCYYMPFDGRSKSATMNRKRSGLFATIWYGVARE